MSAALWIEPSDDNKTWAPCQLEKMCDLA